jgi:hypothetical protein
MDRRDNHPTPQIRNKTAGLRIETPSDVARGEPIEIVFDGHPLTAFRGESIAATLIASSHRSFRVSSRMAEPRGLFCGIGLCFECLVVIDDVPNQRACMTQARDGLRVQTQIGPGLTSTADASSR